MLVELGVRSSIIDSNPNHVAFMSFGSRQVKNPGMRQKSQTHSCLENVGKRMSDEANKQTNKQHNIKSEIPPSVVLMVKIFAGLGLLCSKYCHIDALECEKTHYVKLKRLGSKNQN